jgi:exopolysaccharide production protein ExoY
MADARLRPVDEPADWRAEEAPAARTPEDLQQAAFQDGLRRDLRHKSVVAVGPYLGGWRKRAFDIFGASVGLLLLSPLFVLVALLIKLQDGGAVFYGHERLGYHGRPFRCWKFRSMVRNAEARLEALLARDPAAAQEWRETRKLRRDPRVTLLGLILRRTSIDELPQLFNVLIGEMSLVGPRPITHEELRRFGGAMKQYVRVRPGISGLWQVSGRSDTSYEHRVKLDASYVKTWKLTGDIWIILRTIPSMIRGRGAY